MTIIEIKEDKFDKMAEYTEKMLKYGGKLMSCISEVGEEYGMSFKDNDDMGYREHEDDYNRSMMGNHARRNNRYYSERGSMGYREDDWDDEEMNERRGRRRRDSRGRYY